MIRLKASLLMFVLESLVLIIVWIMESYILL